jgi:HAE1 family hydrophobic/amphiphilic exporter-1
MSLPKFSVERPIAVLMATLAICTFGWLAAKRLPVELLPDLSYPAVTVQTEYPDAAPVSVEQFVSRPIEEAVGVIPGVRAMRSVSRPGISEVILEFEWGEDMDLAAIEVRERIGLVQLPREAEVPRVLRFDPSLEPIVRIAFSGDRPLDELRQLGERWLEPRFEAIEGIAAAKVRGGLHPEIVVEADEDKLAALSLTLDDLADALQAENVNQPGGIVRDFNAMYLVRTLHEFDDLDQLRRTVVREGDGTLVRVEDVAVVRRWHRDRDEISRVGGKEVVELALHREGSANTIRAAAAAREAIDELREELPQGLELTILSDQSRYIAAAIDEVKSSAWLGGLLAILVLFFFLRDAPSTAVIALSIPVSIVATFLPLGQLGVTLNIMSLGGLALGIGMLVDNSIVVLEAIDRHRTLGLSRLEASMRGASEVATAVAASTLTTVAVFLPIVFVKGIAGQLFRDQAWTVCISLMVSLVVALTLVPALAAFEPGRWKRQAADAADVGPTVDRPWTLRLGPYTLPPIGDGIGRGSRIATVLLAPIRLPLLLVLALVGGVGWALSRGFLLLTAPLRKLVDGTQQVYPRLVLRALARPGLLVGAAVLLLAVSIAAVPLLGTRLVPEVAQGEFAFQIRLPEGTPLEVTADTVARIEQPFVGDTNFAKVFSTVGSLPSSASGRRTLGENLAQIDFVLPAGSRRAEQAAAEARVRQVLDRFPRAEAELVQASVLALAPPVGVRLYGEDLADLDTAAEQVAKTLSRIDGLEDLSTTSEPGSPEVQVDLDRERAATLGLSAADIAHAMRRKIGGDVIGEFREGEERIDIRLRSLEPFRDQASEVQDLRLRLPAGTVVPVSAVARIEVGRGPAAIHRAEGSRMAEVTAEAAVTDLGEILAVVEREVAALGRPAGPGEPAALPPGIRLEITGQNEELEVSFDSLKLALGLAIFLVYVVMAAQFESLLHPFVILLSVPLAIIGIVGSLLLTGHPISVLVLIGAVMLAGIVVNNAIVLIDAVNRRRREEGQDVRTALVEAGRERLRPILMTTGTTVLGLAPMALGLGAGDELRAPLAITVIGGLAVSTLLTLVVIPCIYLLFTRERGASEATSLEETQPGVPGALRQEVEG